MIRPSAVRRIRLEVELADGSRVELEGEPLYGAMLSIEPHYAEPLAGALLAPHVLTSVGLTIEMEVTEVRMTQTAPTAQRTPELGGGALALTERPKP